MTTLSLSCRKTYKTIYKIADTANQESASDRTINVRVAFGYMDFGNYTEDKYASAAFATELTSACALGRFACGFKQDPDDADLMTKTVSIMGPDGDLRTRVVRLNIHDSSVTDNELTNRTTQGEQQDAKTAEAQKFFDDGLKQSDIVFYVGHARDGGGPDFAPPVVNNIHRPHRLSLVSRASPRNRFDEQRSARCGARSPKVLGIFACYAQTHFLDWLRALAPKTGLILSGQEEFEASVGQASASLDSDFGPPL